MEPSDLFKTLTEALRNVELMTPTFNAIGLAVADMATSLAFYRRLGLDIPHGADQAPHAEVELPGGLRLMWDTNALIESFDAAFSAKPGAKDGPSLAFLCADAAEVDSVYSELTAAGHIGTKEPWDAEWGQRYALVQDPDGYQVDLFAWVKAPD
jgi:catechol 2,3-dioxygenase-like lactoylglutathione lyase family enzyme